MGLSVASSLSPVLHGAGIPNTLFLRSSSGREMTTSRQPALLCSWKVLLPVVPAEPSELPDSLLCTDIPRGSGRFSSLNWALFSQTTPVLYSSSSMISRCLAFSCFFFVPSPLFSFFLLY